jgi:hypothetical protein
MDKLYPLDVDRAFRKLEQIKPDIATWWTSGGQSAQLISDGEVDMIQAWNGRITAVQAAGAPVAFDYNQGVLETNSLCVLKGSPHKVAAMKFVNEAIDAKLQAALPMIIDYGPLNPEAFKTGVIPAEREAKLPSAPGNISRQALLSAQWWASEAGVKAEERWLSFVQKNSHRPLRCAAGQRPRRRTCRLPPRFRHKALAPVNCVHFIRWHPGTLGLRVPQSDLCRQLALASSTCPPLGVLHMTLPEHRTLSARTTATASATRQCWIPSSTAQ